MKNILLLSSITFFTCALHTIHCLENSGGFIKLTTNVKNYMSSIGFTFEGVNLVTTYKPPKEILDIEDNDEIFEFQACGQELLDVNGQPVYERCSNLFTKPVVKNKVVLGYPEIISFDDAPLKHEPELYYIPRSKFFIPHLLYNPRLLNTINNEGYNVSREENGLFLLSKTINGFALDSQKEYLGVVTQNAVILFFIMRNTRMGNFMREIYLPPKRNGANKIFTQDYITSMPHNTSIVLWDDQIKKIAFSADSKYIAVQKGNDEITIREIL